MRKWSATTGSFLLLLCFSAALIKVSAKTRKREKENDSYEEALVIGSSILDVSPAGRCVSLGGLMFEERCYWSPGKARGTEAVAACGLTGQSHPATADTDAEWRFIQDNVQLFTGSKKAKDAKYFIAGEAPAREAGLPGLGSSMSGEKCLYVKKGKVKDKKCKKKAMIICEADDPSTIEFEWSEWINDNTGKKDEKKGDDKEKVKNIVQKGKSCQKPLAIQCRSVDTLQDWWRTGDQFRSEKKSCSLKYGLECKGKDQASGRCHDYELRVLCPKQPVAWY